MTGTGDDDTTPIVLVVEDNPVNQALIASQLDVLGFRHELAVSGAEALERGHEGAHDLILMDWHLPDLDGLETTRRLRDLGAVDRRGRPVPIIAVTASAMSGDRERCLEAGMDDFLSKPVAIDALDAVVRRWVPDDGRDPRGADAEPRENTDDGQDERPDVATTDGAADAPDLDLAVLAEFCDQLGDRDIVVHVVETYLRELDGRLSALEQAARIGDDATIAAITHTLKSSSALLGATATADACRDAEHTARDPGGAAQLVPAVVARAGAAAAALRRAIPEVSAR